MAHDQIFKQLLRAFLAEFLVLFLPEIGERIDPHSVEFVETEAFTDVPEGRRRTADLVARVRSREGGEQIISTPRNRRRCGSG